MPGLKRVPHKAGTSFGALISSILGVAKARKTGHIVIQDKAGRRIEVPADTSDEKLQEMDTGRFRFGVNSECSVQLLPGVD